MDLGRDHARVVGERLARPLAASALPREVQFPRQPVAELWDEERKVKRGKRDANRAGDEPHGRQVHVELSPQARALDLDRHLLARAGDRPVHLRQGRRGDWFTVEFAKRSRAADAVTLFVHTRSRASFHRDRRRLVGVAGVRDPYIVPPEVHEVFHGPRRELGGDHLPHV